MSIARRVIALAAMAASLALPAAARAANPTLIATVGTNDEFVISLTDANGTRVEQLPAGTYDIVVRDRSRFHNFHLTGPGVDEATTVAQVTDVTWTVTLTPGTYTYVCDPHVSTMHGSFTVTSAAPAPVGLTVARAGDGAGTVTSAPAGINCGETCAASFAAGTSVVLTAVPAPGSTFAGWGGACAGTDPCTLVLDQARSVTATFSAAAAPAAASYVLTVARAGDGSGTVTSTPPGIACGDACSASFPAGTAVTLTATPAAGSSFAGWSGACSGTGPCTLTLGGPLQVAATFGAVAPQPLGTSAPSSSTRTVRPLALSLVRAGTTGPARARRLVLRLRLSTTASVRARLWRGSRIVASRRLRLTSGLRVLSLRLPPALRAGRYVLRVDATPYHGKVRRLSRTVRLR